MTCCQYWKALTGFFHVIVYHGFMRVKWSHYSQWTNIRAYTRYKNWWAHTKLALLSKKTLLKKLGVGYWLGIPSNDCLKSDALSPSRQPRWWLVWPRTRPVAPAYAYKASTCHLKLIYKDEYHYRQDAGADTRSNRDAQVHFKVTRRLTVACTAICKSPAKLVSGQNMLMI